MIDFGGWASEAYRVPTAEAPEIDTSSSQADEGSSGD
jgi:endogenous inhibitor of DNA gyrase (YacG/DUF329 family)